MATTSSDQMQRRSISITFIVVGFFILVLGGWLYWYLQREAPRPQGPVLTGEARAYIRAGSLKLSGVEMKATKSYMSQRLVEITGKIANAGQRNLKQVDLNCVF